MLGLVCNVVAALCITLVFVRWMLNKRRWDLIAKIPGAEAWTFLGSAKELGLFNRSYNGFNKLAIFMQVLEALAIIHRKTKLYKVWLGTSPKVIIFAPETLETVYKSNSLIEKGSTYDLFGEWLGEGLLTSGGMKWKQHRKFLTPTFHFRILDDFMSVMNEQAAIFVNKAKKTLDRDWIDIHHYCSMFTFDVICETAMGVSIGAQVNTDSKYVKALQEFTEIAATRLTKPMLLSDSVFYWTKSYNNSKRNLGVMLEFSQSVVNEKVLKKQNSSVSGDYEEEGKKRLAFLDLLLEHSETVFDPKTLREQVDTFMFAGHDTTGSGLAWTLYLLGLHKDIQTRVHEELDEIFGVDKDRDVTQEDLKQLKYLDCVIKETLRIYSPVPFITRMLGEDTVIGGYNIPKGTELFLGIYLLHHNPEVFPNPEVFDPDRFLPENSAGRHPFAYTPFSAGPRNCIGQRFALMEEKVFLCRVLRQFRVTALDPRDKLHLVPPAILRNDGPLRLHFEERNQ